MGSRVYLYLSLWSLLLVACDRVGWRHEALLDRAEHLLVRQPDSARAFRGRMGSLGLALHLGG